MADVDPRIEMEVTVTFRYKTDPANYEGATDPEEMAQMDWETFDGDYNELADMMDCAEDGIEISVKPYVKKEDDDA